MSKWNSTTADVFPAAAHVLQAGVRQFYTCCRERREGHRLVAGMAGSHLVFVLALRAHLRYKTVAMPLLVRQSFGCIQGHWHFLLVELRQSVPQDHAKNLPGGWDAVSPVL